MANKVLRLAPPIVVPMRDHGVCAACDQKAKVFYVAADSTLLRSCGGSLCEAVIECQKAGAVIRWHA